VASYFLALTLLLVAFRAEDTFPRPGLEIAVIVSVTDGDTLKCSIDGEVKSVRLIAIDAPERSQPSFGRESRDWLRLACPPGSTVILVTDTHHPADSYGRPIRWVEFGGVVLNIEAVRAGQAFAYRPPGRRVDRWAEVQAAEAEAILARRGIWGVPGGVTRPWIWRQQRR
jgi:endonuclease YncB( thermonuclease family)